MRSESAGGPLTVRSESWLDLTPRHSNALGAPTPSECHEGLVAASRRLERSQSVNPSARRGGGDHLLIRLRQRSFLSSRSSLHSHESNDCLSQSVELESRLRDGPERVGVTGPGEPGCSTKREPLRLRSFRDRLQRRNQKLEPNKEASSKPKDDASKRRSWSSFSEHFSQNKDRLWLRGCQIAEKTWKNFRSSSSSSLRLASAEPAPIQSGRSSSPRGPSPEANQRRLELVKRQLTDEWVARHCRHDARVAGSQIVTKQKCPVGEDEDQSGARKNYELETSKLSNPHSGSASSSWPSSSCSSTLVSSAEGAACASSAPKTSSSELTMNPKWQKTLATSTSDYWSGTPTCTSLVQQQGPVDICAEQHQGSRPTTRWQISDGGPSGQQQAVATMITNDNLEWQACAVQTPDQSCPLGGELDEDYAVPTDEQCCRLERSQVELVQLIGEGQKGYVFLGKLQSRDGRQIVDVAIKTLKFETDQLIERLMSEAALMRSLEHPHIIRFIGMCPETPALIAMELAKFGEIKQYLKLNQHLIRRSQLVLFTFQISTALSYLESKNFVHRDVAARNVLVCTPQCVKLADFGLSRNLLQQQAASHLMQPYGASHARRAKAARLSRQLGGGQEDDAHHTGNYLDSQLLLMHHSDRRQPQEAQYVAAPRVKLPVRWLAPESLVFRRFTSASDVWMFAVCTWELFQWGQVRPWPELRNQQVLAAIESGQRLSRPEACPVRLHQLMLHCWSYAPVQRPKFREIKQSIWSIYLNERTREQLELERLETERQRFILSAASAAGGRQPMLQSQLPLILGAGAGSSGHQYYVPPSGLGYSSSMSEDGSLLDGVQANAKAQAPASEAKDSSESRQRALALEAAIRRFAWAERLQPRQTENRPAKLQKQRSQGAIAAPADRAGAGRRRRAEDDGQLAARRQRQNFVQYLWRRSQPLQALESGLPTDDYEASEDGDDEEGDCNASPGSKFTNWQEAINVNRRIGVDAALTQQRFVSASPALTQASETGSARPLSSMSLNETSSRASEEAAADRGQQSHRVAMLCTPSGSPALLGVMTSTSGPSSATPTGSVSSPLDGATNWGRASNHSPSNGSRRLVTPASHRWPADLGGTEGGGGAANQVAAFKQRQPTTHELGQVLQALRLTPMKAKLKSPPEQSVRVLAPIQTRLSRTCRESSNDNSDNNNNNNRNHETSVASPRSRQQDRARTPGDHITVRNERQQQQKAPSNDRQQMQQLQLRQRLLGRIRPTTSDASGPGGDPAASRQKQLRIPDARQASVEIVDQSLQILESLMSPTSSPRRG